MILIFYHVHDKFKLFCPVSWDHYSIASQQLGAGRTRKEDSVDMNAGIYLHKKVGDEVREGDVIATLYSDDEEKLKAGLEKASSAFVISTEPAARPEVIKRVIGI